MMARASLVGLVLLCIGGCGDNWPGPDGAPSDGPGPDSDGRPGSDGSVVDASLTDALIDAAFDGAPSDGATSDGATTDGPVLMGDHLLLTEVALSNNAREFIEIYNPTDQIVDLGDYYLSDTIEYALLPGAFGAGPPPVINTSADPALQFDFIVRFPGGATIAPGQVVVVAMRYTDFAQTFGATPDYAIYQAPAAAQMIDPGGAVFLGIGGNSNLSNGGEMIALLHWDGTSDRVADVDLLNAGGAIPSFNRILPKTGVTVDGPDGDTNATQYQDDADTLGDIDADAPNDQSHKRLLREDGFEVQNGAGNGITGHDETSENIGQTWDQFATFTSPTPGQVPASLTQ